MLILLRGASDRLCANFKMCQAEPIDKKAVTKFALPAGNDVEMGGGSFNFAIIPELIKSGELDINIVDTAVARQLRAKFALGLFENPYLAVPANETASKIHTPEHVALARQLDAESIVLLENDGVLPLQRSANVAVVGPMAAEVMNYGDYVVNGSQYTGVWPLTGISSFSAGTVTYAKGCDRASNDESLISEAVTAAKAADVAVVVVGTWSRDQFQLWQGLNATTGEHVDVNSLNLVGAMPKLVQEVINTGKPTVVVYSSGKPVTEPWISEHAAAVVQQFYPSEQGGNALADVLYGEVNPSGRLSVSFPHDVGSLPIYYDYLNSGRATDSGTITDNGTLVFGHQYALGTPQPLYEFGYGLSYTNFTYSNLRLSSNRVGANDNITVSVDVTNTGGRDGAEVVQLYVSDVLASVVVPNTQLRGFEKIAIPAGNTVTVDMPLNMADLGLWDINMKYVVEPGDFNVTIGRSSLDIVLNATLTVVGL